MREALDRAYAEQHWGEWKGNYVGLSRNSRFHDLVNSMDMVDARGQMAWNVPVRSRRLTVGRIEALRDRGLSDVDLDEPIFAGDELSPEGWFGEAEGWAQVLGAIYGILEVGGDIGGAAVSLALLWRVLKRYWREWRRRGATPEDVLRLVNKKRLWESRELATLLGIPQAKARELLRALGYRYDRSLRMFRHSGSAEDRIRQVLEKHFEDWHLR